MNPRRLASLTLACLLQWLPLVRVAFVQEALLGTQAGVVLRFLIGGAALLGSYDAVSGASASIAGMVKYVGNTVVGTATNRAVEPVSSTFKYRITVKNAGSDIKKDYFNCQPLPPGLTINTALGGNGYITGTPTTAGTYAVLLTAGNTSYPVPVTMNATIVITGSDTPPTITSQPQAVTTALGGSASFSVVASGTAPLAYQWSQGASPILNATNANLTLATTTLADAGDYSVTVSNTAGSVTSNPAKLTVVPPPVITTQPQPITVAQGATATFTVVATSSTPLSYQWSKGASPIPNATNATLTLTAVASADSGDYSVAVSNTAGTVASNPAKLTVILPPVITAQPQSITVAQGASATFAVVATSSTPLAYQWSKGASPIPDATNATLTLKAVALADAGDYSVVVSNAAGPIASAPATLTVVLLPAITAQPQSISVAQGASATFSVAATSSTPLSYQWSKGASPILDATNATFTLTAATLADAGDYTVTLSNAAGSVISTPATLTVILPPVITTQPQSLTVAQGASATLSVVATSSTPLSYQWSKGASPILDATNATFTLTAVALADAGDYSVTVSNAAGPVVSTPATLTVVLLPAITTQPQSLTVAQGASATLSVVATSSTPLSYQWSKGASPILDATNATFTLTAVALADAGDYSVTVSNAAGPVVSTSATLTVVAPPTLTTQPQPITVNEGASATFSVVAASTASLSYQWLMNTQEIPGATQSTLTLASVKASDAGTYSVRVSNVGGSVVSEPVTLTVNTQPPAEVKLSLPKLQDGQLTFQISGPAGSKYTIWGSTDLVQWESLKTIDGTSLPVEFTETPSTAIPIRFYKVTIAP